MAHREISHIHVCAPVGILFLALVLSQNTRETFVFFLCAHTNTVNSQQSRTSWLWVDSCCWSVQKPPVAGLLTSMFSLFHLSTLGIMYTCVITITTSATYLCVSYIFSRHTRYYVDNNGRRINIHAGNDHKCYRAAWSNAREWPKVVIYASSFPMPADMALRCVAVVCARTQMSAWMCFASTYPRYWRGIIKKEVINHNMLATAHWEQYNSLWKTISGLINNSSTLYRWFLESQQIALLKSLKK